MTLRTDTTARSPAAEPRSSVGGGLRYTLISAGVLSVVIAVTLSVQRSLPRVQDGLAAAGLHPAASLLRAGQSVPRSYLEPAEAPYERQEGLPYFVKLPELGRRARELARRSAMRGEAMHFESSDTLHDLVWSDSRPLGLRQRMTTRVKE